jgi:hypothetical protein
MNPLEYLHLQLRLEGKEVIHGDRLRQVQVVPDEEMPVIVLARLADKRVVAYYDESLKPELYSELRQKIETLAFPVVSALLDLLKSKGLAVEMGHYKTYAFPKSTANVIHDDVVCLSRQHPAVRSFGFGDFAERVYVIERDGKIASACVSTRENAHCGEAWVYTDEQYRRRGFAQQVVQAWAQDMLRSGKLPFYSHKIQNIASAKLAKCLELVPVFEEIAFSYVKEE